MDPTEQQQAGADQADGQGAEPLEPQAQGADDGLDDRARALIQKQRASEQAAIAAAKDAKRQLAEVQAKLKEHDDAKLSELERAQQRVTALEAEAEQFKAERKVALVRSAVEAAARDAGAVDPDAVYRLLDLDALDTATDDGHPRNAKALVNALLKEKPYLLGGGQGGAAMNAARSGATSPDSLSDGTSREQAMQELFGGGKNRAWDLDNIRSRGGGLRWDPSTNPKQRGPLWAPGTKPD